MDELKMPTVEKGWLDSYKVGDRVYLFHRTGWTGEQVEVLTGEIVRTSTSRRTSPRGRRSSPCG